jgi:hypothetical protein
MAAQEPGRAPGAHVGGELQESLSFDNFSVVGMAEPAVGVGTGGDDTDPFGINNLWSSSDNMRRQFRRFKMCDCI